MANERRSETQTPSHSRVHDVIRHYRVLVHSTLFAVSAAGVAAFGLAVML